VLFVGVFCGCDLFTGVCVCMCSRVYTVLCSYLIVLYLHVNQQDVPV
jgi:hypothetical protein